MSAVASTSKLPVKNNNAPVAIQGPTVQDVHLLIQHVARAFYDARVTVLFDQMIRGEAALRDEALAAKLGVQLRDLSKIAQPLIDHRLLAVYRRNEVREGSIKAVARTWYFLDLKTFIDATKWRMYKVRKTIDDKLRDEIKSQGYDCPLCKASYSTLDVSHLQLDPTTYQFKCDVCGTILIDNETTAEAELGKTKIRRLLEQCKHVMDLLKKTESFVVPAFHVGKWLEINYPVAESISETKEGPDGIKIATGGAQVAKFKVELADESDLQAIKEAKEKAAELTRVQNALPSWIEKSTVDVGGKAKGVSSDEIELNIQPPSPDKVTFGAVLNDDQALMDYYAKTAALEAETASRGRSSISTPLPASLAVDISPQGLKQDSDDDEDDLFEPVQLANSGTLTPPTSFEEDVKPIHKPKNANGKRSREVSIEALEGGPDEEEDFGAIDFGLPEEKRIKLTPEPTIADQESDEEEFEAVV